MRKLILLIAITGLSLIFIQSLAAQEQTGANNLAYIEVGGAGVIWTVNLEVPFKNNDHLGLGYRIGAGYIKETVLFPVGVNYVFGKQNSAHTFITGAGLTFVMDKMVFDPPAGFFSLMYRYLLVNNCTLHVGFTPLIENSGKFTPWGAIGIGYTF